MSIELATASIGLLTSSSAVKAAYEILKTYIASRTDKHLPVSIDSGSEIGVIEEAVKEAERNLSVEDDFRITTSVLDAARKNLDLHRRERIRQAKITFNSALALSILGVLIIFVGIVFILIRNAALVGSVTASVGAVTEVVSAILFRFNKETNDRLDEIGRNVQVIEAAQMSMSLILTNWRSKRKRRSHSRGSRRSEAA